jgi:hypothetical protein
MLTRAVTSSFPSHDRTRNAYAARRNDASRESIGHVRTQRGVRQQARHLRSPSSPIGVPLRRRRAIFEPAAARGGIASQLTRNRRGGTRQATRDLPYAVSLCSQHRQLLALRK